MFSLLIKRRNTSSQRKIDMAKQVARHGQIAFSFSFSNSLGKKGVLQPPQPHPWCVNNLALKVVMA